MKTRAFASFSLSTLMLGGTMAGCAGGDTGIASASARNQGVSDMAAAANAARASKALNGRNAAAAIGFAESAVGMSPARAEYRSLLGRSYLQAGRFTSARQALADAMQLAPDNGKTALNYALAQIATGDWDGARKTLTLHAAAIPANDLGLAMALAGDPASAVALLTQAARTPGADAKTRQNLALALALAGQWGMAKIVAEADMSPADVDTRMTEWAAFAQPVSASDQVAALLGVAAVQDAGQPIALALNAPVMPVMTPEQAPTAVAAVVAPPVPVAAPAAIDVAAAPVTVPVSRKISFGPRAEVVQAIPATMIRPAAGGFKLAVAKAAVIKTIVAKASIKTVVAKPVFKSVPAVPATGDFYVQLGAFENAGVARREWERATRRYAALSSHIPTGMNFSTKTGNFYRLSVGGFTRADADAMCRKYRALGGACFVRAGAGDQTVLWLRKGREQTASR